jgi:hypothetical protein
VAGGNVPLKDVLNANPVYAFRSDVGDLKPLIQSIRKNGQEAPVILDGSYLILDGARRVEALKRMHATTVWAISTDDWLTTVKLFQEVAQRHKTADFKQKKFMDLGELLVLLGDRSRNYGRANARKRGTMKGRPDGALAYRGPHTPAVFLAEIEGIPMGATLALSRVMNRIHEQRFLSEHENVALIIAELEKYDGTGKYPYRLADEVLYMIDPDRAARREADKPRPPASSQSIRAQAKAINRSLNLMQGIVAALPTAAAISPEHALEEIEKWQKEITKITAPIRRINVQLTRLKERKNGQDQADDQED